MIINIRSEISKSFFFINIKPPSCKKLASTQQLVFPTSDYTISKLQTQSNKLNLIKKIEFKVKLYTLFSIFTIYKTNAIILFEPLLTILVNVFCSLKRILSGIILILD